MLLKDQSTINKPNNDNDKVMKRIYARLGPRRAGSELIIKLIKCDCARHYYDTPNNCTLKAQ